MGQSTFDDDDLFGEAAAETRAEVESHLEAARAELPDPDSVWETEGDNVLGVLNGLKSALDAGDAADHLRQAKKAYVLGERADAFEDADDLEAAIDDVADLIADLEDAAADVADLTGTVPAIRGALQDAAADDAEDADDASDADDGADASAEADDAAEAEEAEE
ncbi:DUF5790 family protein [Halopenitus persicus]|uniref:Uncharacterized protein n=1 Tax=Halopenitus persicus TaxID=1048396 RepID=A0A1H3FI69_9EURY|nr:DUF5790 family protein [Halopenitus persicus]QHS16637.1 hypothetical protein GWK26_05455 [haloarchaeon 3A1-DGR]SDX90058.1 hypothetical protein SAMN05216564_10243 [Halopenitus persicus]